MGPSVHSNIPVTTLHPTADPSINPEPACLAGGAHYDVCRCPKAMRPPTYARTLHDAVMMEDLVGVRWHLDENPGLINSIQAGPWDKELGSPLSIACRWGSTDIVRLLLERGADPNLIVPYRTQDETRAEDGTALLLSTKYAPRLATGQTTKHTALHHHLNTGPTTEHTALHHQCS